MLRFQEGDETAFERIVVRYRRPVEHFLRRYLSDRHRAEDLTQDVFVRVYRARRRYEPSAKFRTWLFTIASRLALNEIRGVRRRRRVFTEKRTEETDEYPGCDDRADTREPPPEAGLAEKELEDVLDDLIERLPANQRAALVLSRVEDLSYRDIGETLGVSVKAVKSLLMRARETLRRWLEPYLESGRLEKGIMEPRRKA